MGASVRVTLNRGGRNSRFDCTYTMIWRTVSGLVDKAISLDLPRGFASQVIRWYDLIHSTWYSAPDQVTIIIMCMYRSVWALLVPWCNKLQNLMYWLLNHVICKNHTKQTVQSQSHLYYLASWVITKFISKPKSKSHTVSLNSKDLGQS